jgi:hypothetical protein
MPLTALAASRAPDNLQSQNLHAWRQAVSTTVARPASISCFDKIAPQHVDPSGKAKTWITRGGNFVVAVSRVETGGKLVRENNADEYMVIIPPNGPSATIVAGKETIEAGPDSLTIVPPGSSTVTAKGSGLIARVISKLAGDMTTKAVNAAGRLARSGRRLQAAPLSAGTIRQARR